MAGHAFCTAGAVGCCISMPSRIVVQISAPLLNDVACILLSAMYKVRPSDQRPDGAVNLAAAQTVCYSGTARVAREMADHWLILRNGWPGKHQNEYG